MGGHGLQRDQGLLAIGTVLGPFFPSQPIPSALLFLDHNQTAEFTRMPPLPDCLSSLHVAVMKYLRLGTL